MNDTKLGLAIAGADQGYRIIATINDGQWIDNVSDIREDLKLIPNRRTGDSILMLTCIDSGFLLIIASPIGGRQGDYISAWIYIPDGLEISGQELKSVINKTKEEILTEGEINKHCLYDIFDKSYDVNRIKHNLRPDDGCEQQYACRHYGNGSGSDWSLSDLLQPDRLYQPYYPKYRCIFFIDKQTELTCADSVKDLTSETVLKSVYMDEPKPVHRFEPYIDGKKFNSARYFTEGERVCIEWKRAGYKSIPTHTDIKEGAPWNIPQENQYIRLIPYEFFKIIDSQSELPIEKYTLRVDNQEIYEEGEPAKISEDTLRNVCVSVEADGYNPYKAESCDLTTIGSCLPIKLEKRKYNYHFSLQARDRNNDYKLDITSTHNQLSKSPIKGYESEGGYPIRYDTPTKLVYSSQFDKTFWICTAIILSTVFIVGIGLGGVLYWKFITPIQEANWAKKEHRTTDNAPTATTTVNDDTVIQYLDEHDEWEKGELENFPKTKGLFDALTTHQFSAISSYKNKLKNSKQFKEVMDAIMENKNKSYSEPYKEKPDSIITVEKYIRHLNKNE